MSKKLTMATVRPNLPHFNDGFYSAFDAMEEAFGRLPDYTDKFGLNVGPWTNSNFPPHNIVKVSDTEYQIEMAVAGYKPEEIEVKLAKDGTNILEVTGESRTENSAPGKNYIHKGISTKNFTKQFRLAENVRIASATFKDGMLTVSLIQEAPKVKAPESKWEKVPLNAK